MSKADRKPQAPRPQPGNGSGLPSAPSLGPQGCVRAFGALLEDPHTRLILADCATPAERLRFVERLGVDVMCRLSAAAARVPTVPERIADLYRAQGKPVPTWDLDNDDLAVEFCLTIRHDAKATSAELRAAEQLRACVLARELGDVEPFADMTAGARLREARETGSRNAADKAAKQTAADATALRDWATAVIAQDPSRRGLPFPNRAGLIGELQGALEDRDQDTVAAKMARRLRPGFPTSSARLHRLLGTLADDELKKLCLS